MWESVGGVRAIILAAGKGTRMKADKAKVLHEIMGRPMLEYVLDVAEEVAGDGIVVVVGYQAEAVRKRFESRNVRFVDQAEQLGTGHAVMCARQEVSEYEGSVLVLCGDVPFLRGDTVSGLIRRHVEEDASLSILTTIVEDPSHYGRVIKDDTGKVVRVVEERDATAEERLVKEINTGIYCAQSGLLFEALEKTGRGNVQGEYYLTDVAEVMSRGGRKVIGVVTERHEEVIGINTRADLARATGIKRAEINEKWMVGGVTIIDSVNTYIEPSVTLGRDVVIYPYTIITGASTIGGRSIVLPFCHIENSTVGSEARIGPFAVIRGSAVPDQGEIGPFKLEAGRE